MNKIEVIENIYVISGSEEKLNRFNDVFTYFGFKDIHVWKACMLKNGVLGCSISHYSLIKYAQQLKLPYIIIFEDDAIPCNNAYEKTLNYIKCVPDDCKYLILGWTRAEKQNSLEIQSTEEFKMINGSHAYVLFESGYNDYLKAFETNYIADFIWRNMNSVYKVKDCIYCQYNTKPGIHLPQGWSYNGKILNSAPEDFSDAEQFIKSIRV